MKDTAKYADLHIHTRFSDGTFTPSRVVSEAKKNGLCCIAVTDHDEVRAIGPAQDKARRLDIEVVPGVELSAEIDNCEVHILGYFIEWQAQWFQRKLKQICGQRQRRALAIIEKLKAYGIKLNREEVLRQARIGSVGRLHIARMLQSEGFVHSIQEAFDKYIADGGPCYVKKFKLTPFEVIEMIRRLKGVAVLAHPYTIGNDEIISEFVRMGLRGIEAYYSEQNQATSRHYQKLAAEYGLLVTGGSDCHGLAKDGKSIGSVKLPYQLVEALKEEAEALRSGKKT